MKTKTCAKCLKRKRLTSFNGVAQGRPHTYCKLCQADYMRGRNYGISAEQFQALVLVQNNRCGICRKKMKPPHVDHNHLTGKIRGLLCSACNLGLGKLGDRLIDIARANLYLVEHDNAS